MNVSNSNNNSAIISIIAAFALLVIGGLLIGEIGTPLVLPIQASAESKQVDTLFKIMLTIGGSIYLLVQGTIIYAVIRFRVKPGDTSDGPNMHGNPTLEFVWTLIPAIIVLALSILSFQTWVSITSAKEGEMEVHATGGRFNWSFSYDVPDQDITVNSRVLHTFVGQPIKMVLETTDVNHAFFIPAMRIKQDLLAGRTTEIRFTPTLAGDYPVLCAELCGSGHGDMRATIVVHPDEATFLTWFDPEVDALLNPPEDPVALGEQLLSAGPYPCAGCHTLETLGWTGNVGPNQNGIGDRASRREPGLTAEEYLFRSLYFPAEYLAPGFGALMPPFQANDPDGANYMPVDDARAIVAYLCTQTESSESACDLDNLASLTPES
jgi:cytochrome c oxidase subunit 2